MSRPQQQTAVVNGHVKSPSPDHQRSTKVFSGNSHPLVQQHKQQEAQNLHHKGGVVRPSLQKPQISIEEADGHGSLLSPPKSPPYDKLASLTENDIEPMIGDSHSAPGSPYKASVREQETRGTKKSSPQHLMVRKTTLKSNSLPMGMSMTAVEVGHTSSHSPSDSEYSDEAEPSSPTKAPVVNGDEHLLHVARKKRSETIDSLYSESDSGSSSEDEKMAPILQAIPDDPFDDVFQDVEIDMGSEVDSKLIDWAFNVFVPACCTLLSRCAKMEAQKESPHHRNTLVGATALLFSDGIQSDLRNLSNTINYFCSEQQRLSGLLKAKISSSVSTDRMSRIATNRASTLQAQQSSSNTSSFSETSSGSFDSHDSQTDRSYAVKILRSVSQSLIAPLLHEAEDGFTHELYKSIIQALQKISWKVEACLSFNDPSKEFEIHAKIFDSGRIPAIRSMMIGALPPEEPKLQVVGAAHASRSNSISSPKRQATSPTSGLSPESNERSKTANVIRRTPSGRERPVGSVFDSGALPETLKVANSESSDSTKDGKSDGGKETPPSLGSLETTPTTPHRTRTATTSQLELSPSHKSRFSARPGFSKSFDQDSFDEDSVCPQYFRPKAARRTTISLSRKEVTNLGLTVAKRIEESIMPEVAGSKFESNESGLHVSPVLTEDDIRKRLHDSLAVEFNRTNESTRYFERVRSASMSDLLEDDFGSQTPPRRHDSFQGLAAGEHSNSGENINGSVGTLDSIDDDISISSARIEQAYVPSPRRVPTSSSMDTSCESDWVYIKRPGASTMARQSSIQSEPATPRKKDKKSKVKNKNVDKVKKNVGSSGKFADKLMKTAQALRRASVVSKPKKFERKRINSVDLLSETSSSRDMDSALLKPRGKHSRSEPASPIPPKPLLSNSNTAPSSSKHRSLKRFIAKKSKSFNSKDSLGRKIRGKSEFLQDYGETEMEREIRLSFTESIENYSKIAVKPKASEGEPNCPCV